MSYDSILIVGFGGPEKPQDVMAFLENVTRGRRVPRERLLEVAAHYHHLGGRSPINDQVRELISALKPELRGRSIELPVYWGNRNWHPLLGDTMKAIHQAGHRLVLAIVLSAYSSYSSCRQYLENIDDARAEAGAFETRVDKLRVFFNHPSFIAANANHVTRAIQSLAEPEQASARIVFTAHSIPASMAQACRYEEQIRETSALIADALSVPRSRWSVCYQSRSGRPEIPWLGPDILDELSSLRSAGSQAVVIHPVGFLSDHMEVLYDLDIEAAQQAEKLGLAFARSRTVGTHPLFVSMLAELVAERLGMTSERRAIGRIGPGEDDCQEECCPAGTRAREGGQG
jgi:ferrochelatase